MMHVRGPCLVLGKVGFKLKCCSCRRGPDGHDGFGIHSVHPVGMWGAPFIMAPVNTRVVRRSNAVLGHQYGEHMAATGRMVAGRHLASCPV